MSEMSEMSEMVERAAEAMYRPGRPRRTGPAPWEVYGYSRRTYYRRKKLGLLPRRATCR